MLMIYSPDSKPSQAVATTKALLAYKTRYTLPKSVRYHSAKSHLIENLMFRAIQHWCCISFKIVPIELEVIKKDTPKCILYCVAAISLVTTTTTTKPPPLQENRQNKVKKFYDKSAEGFKKDVGFYFYERAVSFLNEVLFNDEEEVLSVTAIQCYFCLSYTANLLRLTGEQRTWHYLACDQLISKVKYINDSAALRQCWYRWYYIDAWIALSLNMECLLPDKLPFVTKRPVKTSTTTVVSPEKNKGHSNCCIMSNDTLYEFMLMTQFMRRFNRCIQSGTLVHCYDALTVELEHWWQSITNKNLHLAICYHSMRLVILFSLLQQSHIYNVDDLLLLDGLDMTLQILQGLQDLKLMKCDQSTYHHMFFAVHKTLMSILTHIGRNEHYRYLESFAKQQFEMNLCILEGTEAFINDIYAMRTIGSMIEDDLISLGYIQNDEITNTKKSIHVFRATKVARLKH
ncbi:hypothetical protein INT47_008867 [Mucor saturninus]|uniref:Transcription factor domain-containing protein n=1 Tax=Mucor saturninus TaxID=64648 RepID=A0A8H7R3A9_9FUNG|nr:hypothetical protein INT47_008867 [Mucor saturninus]